MGKIIRGLFGGFSGTVGPVVGSRWKDIYYIRSRAARVSNPNTVLQQRQRGKFRTTVNFLKTILPVIRLGFMHCGGSKSAYNAAISYQMRYAFTGSGASARMDYAKVRISQGSLTPAEVGTVRFSPGIAKFSWRDNSGEGDALPDDVSMAVVFNATRGESVSLQSGAARSVCAAVLYIPQGWEYDELAVYLGFFSVDGVRVSNSVCLFSGCPAEGETDVLGDDMPVLGDKADGTTGRLTDGMQRIRNSVSSCRAYISYSPVPVPILRSRWSHIRFP